MKSLFIAITLGTFAFNAFALQTMDGISFNHFRGFEKKWKLITVRFRQDNRELRYVYANPVAAKAFESQAREFPDGSILAKVAYLAEPDPAFESSLGPSQTRRFQFMVKDRKKYQANKGWGYALFDHQGDVANEPEVNQIRACASCHDIVPERDYVFSRKALAAPGLEGFHAKIGLEEVPRHLIVPEIVKHLPSGFSSVLKVKSELTKNIFQGTLDELKPTLARIVVEKKKPVLFQSEKDLRFTLIYPEDLTLECNDEGAKGLFVVSVNSLLKGETNKVHFCQSFGGR